MNTSKKQRIWGFNNEKPGAGKILISEPFAHDFFFGRSVVLLADHETSGSFGVVVNKPSRIKIREVFPDLSEFDDCLFIGGPVNRDQIFFIHTLGDSVPETLSLSENLYWGGDISRIKHLITAGLAGPHNLRFFSGYSGWAAKQLDEELKRKSWLVSVATHEILLDREHSQIWRNSVMKAGKEFSTWVNFPLQPEMN